MIKTASSTPHEKLFDKHQFRCNIIFFCHVRFKSWITNVALQLNIIRAGTCWKYCKKYIAGNSRLATKIRFIKGEKKKAITKQVNEDFLTRVWSLEGSGVKLFVPCRVWSKGRTGGRSFTRRQNSFHPPALHPPVPKLEKLCSLLSLRCQHTQSYFTCPGVHFPALQWEQHFLPA